MTTLPNVIEAASARWIAQTSPHEIRMSASTRDELVRRLNLTRPADEPPVPLIEGGMQGTIFGTPVYLDEAMTGTRWEMRDHDGAVIQSGAL